MGTAQSGQIISIGFDLYCSLLRQAVSKLKGEKVQTRAEAAIRLEFVVSRETELAADDSRAPAFLPVSYISDSQARVHAYRKLNEIATQEQLDALRKTWRDRFGKLPRAVENQVVLNEIKLAAAARKIASVEVRDEKVMLKRGGDYILLGT